MSHKSLPSSPNLNFLRKQAKEYLKAHRRRDPECLTRVRASASKLQKADDETIWSSRLTLGNFQHFLALEYGFTSWVDMKEFVQSQGLAASEAAKEFIIASLRGNVRYALRLLANYPQLSEYDMATACIVGNHQFVQQKLSVSGDVCNDLCGVYDWPALAYLTQSHLHTVSAEQQQDMLQTAKLLLDSGANPNAKFPLRWSAWAGEEMPVLYGACGVSNHPELAAMLLSAGADPDDGESLYHSAEWRDHKCLQVMLRHGVREIGAVLHRMLDYDDVEGVRMLLDHDADPNFCKADIDHPILHGIKRQIAPATMQLLIDHGADIAKVDPQELRDYCVRYGYAAASLPAIDDMSEVEQLLWCCTRGDVAGATRVLASHPEVMKRLTKEDQRVLPEMAMRGNLDAVKACVEVGFDQETTGDWEGTAIHQAAWLGHIDVVKYLLAAGSKLETVNGYGGTVLGTALHGSINAHSDGDYPGIVETLLEAGAIVLANHTRLGSDECEDVLQAYQRS